ncbi:SixA phosphatase family protein [Tenacibaculum sp. M341]|uniref:SixA phosphatase family protein n=1 Tax=Tenacibaculum sp. M341 TaxID=2530339 RepID=UPI001047D31D|nr:phosphoglycerate mutase family protein [Tenacibaculum sp. M341]TCI93754.1 histidine phosphatase family protein [Tenacibaculum sp. M341]
MKKLFFIVGILISFKSIAQSNAETTQYFLVRHAEKQVDGTKNPHLTKEGFKRAAQWANALKYYKIDAVYATDYYRTKETAQPVAKANNVTITSYHPHNIDYKKFMSDTKGKKVVVVGHSNTIPNFVNKLIGKDKYKELSEKVYGNFYIVTLNKDGSINDIVLNF